MKPAERAYAPHDSKLEVALAMTDKIAHDVRLKPTRCLQDAIWSIDLRQVKEKLMDPVHGQGWSSERAEEAELKYRRFLFMTVTRPEAIVPTADIDDVWHAHILDTRAYARDCDSTFGFFLHHFPYFGMRGSDDAVALSQSFRRTALLYENLFQQPYALEVTDDAGCSSCRDCSSCRGNVHATP
jgi:hypothetical protein